MLPDRNPWIDRYQERPGFAVQAFALPGDRDATRKVIAAGLQAEEAGLDGFFIGDHPGYATEPWLHLTAIAVQTSRIHLGSMVHCASYRHPAMLARLAADFDQISHGRQVLGLGIGWNEPEFSQLDVPFTSIPTRQQALEEYLQILTGVWGDEPFTFHGRHWSTTGGHVVPGPVQQPRPPIVIAGSGEQTTLNQVARLADACNFGPGRNTGSARSGDEIRRKLDILANHCRDAGRDYDDILKSHFTSWLMIAPTERAAIAKRDHYYPDGMTDEQRVTRIVGTPEQVAGYYQGIIDAGMQYIVAQVLDAGDAETIQLFASEVVPELRYR